MNMGLNPGEDFQLLLERQVRDLQAKSSALQEALAGAGQTVRSRSGAVTVTLEANGALKNLQLDPRAVELGSARLTAEIMTTVREAQRQTARAVTESFVAVDGDSETAELVRSFLPPEPEEPASTPDDEPPQQSWTTQQQTRQPHQQQPYPQQPPSMQPPPAQPPPRQPPPVRPPPPAQPRQQSRPTPPPPPAPRRRPVEDDDPDSGEGIMRRW